MFSSIRIKKFRSCADVSLETIEEILVLIGRNGAGKTNILKAIAWACDFASRIEPTTRGKPSRSVGSSSGEVDLTFTINKTTYRYQLKFSPGSFREINGTMSKEKDYLLENVATLSKAGKWVPVISRKDENLTLHSVAHYPNMRHVEISGLSPSLVTLQSLLPESDYYRETAAEIISFFSKVRYYPLHNYDDNMEDKVLFHNEYQKWLLERFSDNNSPSSLVYKILDLSLNYPDKFSELKSLLGEDGLEIISDITIISQPMGVSDESSSEKENKFFHMIFFTPASDPGRMYLRFNDLSFGTKRLLYLLVAMVYDETSVSLVEQPEDGVHIALVEKLIPLFQANSEFCQFIIASHSTAVLNNVHPEMVRIVSMKDGASSARALNEHELEAAEAFLKENGPLSDFFETVSED